MKYKLTRKNYRLDHIYEVDLMDMARIFGKITTRLMEKT